MGTTKRPGSSVPLEAAISPYHLTTREAPAMVASLVCDSAVTFLPSPSAASRPSSGGVDLESFADALAHAPRYRALLDSWAWCSPLWDAGVLVHARDGFDPGDDVVSACERLMSDETIQPLRSLAQQKLFDSVEVFLDLVSRDILRAGSNPGVSIPVSHGLDEFALAQGLVVIRPEPASLVQRFERKCARLFGTVSVPIVQQGDGRCVMEARDALADPLDQLRDAIEAIFVDAAGEIDDTFHSADARLCETAQNYAGAFARIEDKLARVPTNDEPRFIAGQVTLTLATLPRGVVFSSALAAGQQLVHAGAQDSPQLNEGNERFAVMFVKSLGARSGEPR